MESPTAIATDWVTHNTTVSSTPISGSVARESGTVSVERGARTLRQMFEPEVNGKVKAYTVRPDALTKLQGAFKGAAEEAGFETEEQLDEYVLSVRRERQSRGL